MPGLPAQFIAQMGALLGGEAQAFFSSLDSSFTGVRANLNKISPFDLKSLLPVPLQRVPWSESGFWLRQSDIDPAQFRPGRHPYHAAGLYYLQDPSAMVVAELLAPQPGELVLDLCAAPGGKSTHIAGLMGNHGTLIANEIHPKRVWELVENLERCGVRNAVVTNEKPERLSQVLGPVFDRLLVDAPCSGEAMFPVSETARREWTPRLVETCALRQSSILEAASSLLRPGGILTYSTCTFNPVENEGVIARFLIDHPQFKMLRVRDFPGFAPGRPDWLEKQLSLQELEHAIRLWPHRSVGDGHFIAVLQNTQDRPVPHLALHWPHKSPKPAMDRFLEFCDETLTADGIHARQDLIFESGVSHQQPSIRQCFVEAVEAGKISMVGSHLYWTPEHLLALETLRLLQPGWKLGSVFQGAHGQAVRFDPAHSLAMGLSVQDCRRSTGWKISDPEVISFLRGETLPAAGEKGWLLATVDDFALGWSKLVAGVLKNHYPRALRWY